MIANNETNLLEVRNLNTVFDFGKKELQAVRGVSFDVKPGRIVGLVGESGSGKSVTARSIMGMVPRPGRIAGGEVLFQGRNIVGLSEEELRRIRGKQIAMVFQDPQAALNPVKTVGWQIEEALRVHGMPKDEARVRSIELLRQVGIPEPDKRVDEFPHQFSGGMRQRVVIAVAIANSAPLIIADEPTTALDTTIQAQVLRLLAELRDQLNVGVMMITHDMGVVAELCDDVIVMYGGRVVEQGLVRDIFSAPQHPYTRDLLRSMPKIEGRAAARLAAIPGSPPDLANLPTGCAFHPRCRLAEDRCKIEAPPLERPADHPQALAACWVTQREGHLPAADAEQMAARDAMSAGSRASILSVKDLRVDFGSSRCLLGKTPPFYALDGVSLELAPGETLGLVGESGSGKTTLARAIVGINKPASGSIAVLGKEVSSFDAASTRTVRDNLQYVFQDPYASLNPRLTIRQILEEALEQRGVTRRDMDREATELMELVGLGPQHLDRYPHAFSGGQRQRIGIARALAVQPEVLICDEPVSALDLSIQAQVINVLADLRDKLGLALLFIAHDLAVVRHLSDRVAVMYLGRIIETGPADEVYSNPRHPYTAILMSSTPRPVADAGGIANKVVLDGDLPNPRKPPSGCRFRTRCPIGPLHNPDRTICSEVDPTLQGDGQHLSACHFANEAAALLAEANKPALQTL